MEKKHKTYLKLNLMSLFFLAVSFISVTLAWFAYSGFASSGVNVDIKAWHIEFNGKSEANNEIIIPFSTLYPGMDTVIESVNIKNKGDGDAKLSYKIKSVRILDDELDTSIDQNILRDTLSNGYPFSIDVALSKEYIDGGGGEASIDLSVSWPLDSGSNEDDSKWGNLTYDFQSKEALKEDNEPGYYARSSVKIVIDLIAEQNIDKFTYNTGNMILFNPELNDRCDVIGGNCYRTNLITPYYDDNDIVKLLPNILNNYGSGDFDSYELLVEGVSENWIPEVEPLSLKDMINLVGNDVHETYLIRNKKNLSDKILGYIGEDRFESYVSDQIVKYEGYIRFDSTNFDYLDTNKCYWINQEYDQNRAFAFTKLEDGKMKIYAEDKESICYIVPVLKVPRDKLYTE